MGAGEILNESPLADPAARRQWCGELRKLLELQQVVSRSRDGKLDRDGKKLQKMVDKSHATYDKSREARAREREALFAIANGRLELPAQVQPVKVSDPGVQAQFSKSATVYSKHPQEGSGPYFDVAKGTPCILHEGPDKNHVFVEIVDAAAEKFKIADDVTAAGKILKTGWTAKGAVKAKQRYVPAEGPLFPGKPSPKDIKQGALADCYFLSTLISIVDKNPDAVKHMLLDNGDGSVTVKMYEKSAGANPGEFVFNEKFVTLPKTVLAAGDDGQASAKDTLWVQMLEKAYAIHAAETQKRSRSLDGVAWGKADPAFEALLGAPSASEPIKSPKELLHEVFSQETVGAGEAERNDAKFDAEAGKALAKLGVPGKEAAALMAQVRGKSYATKLALMDDLTATGLFDQSGALAGVTPTIWRGNIVGAMRAGFDDGTTALTTLKGTAAFQQLQDNPTPRREDAAALFDLPEFKALPAGQQQQLRTSIDKRLPGQRFSGQYSDDELLLYRGLEQAFADDAILTALTQETVGRKVDQKGKSGGEKVSKGLAGSHDYAVLGLVEPKKGEPGWVQPQPGGQPIKYVRVRNPWGDDDPGDDKPSAGRVYGPGVDASGHAKPLMAQASHDATFLMELGDFAKRFGGVAKTAPLIADFGRAERAQLASDVRQFMAAADVAVRMDEATLLAQATDIGRRKGYERARAFAAQRLKLDPDAIASDARPLPVESDKPAKLDTKPTAMPEADAANRQVEAWEVEQRQLMLRRPLNRADRQRRDELLEQTRALDAQEGKKPSTGEDGQRAYARLAERLDALTAALKRLD